MEKRERMEFNGTIIDANKGKFKVQINDNYVVSCTLSGKIRQNSVKILIGDLVTVEVSPFDVTQGRIVYRHKA